MASFQLEVTADGTDTAWTKVGAASSKWESVLDTTDGNYISSGTATQKQTFVLENLPAGAVLVIGDVNAFVRAEESSASAGTSRAIFRKSGGTYVNATSYNPTGSWADYATNTLIGPWTVADINAGEIGVEYVTNPGGVNSEVTRLYLEGTYQASGINLAPLVMCLVGSMLGTNLMLSDMPGIAREVALRKLPGEGRTIIQPDEYADTLRVLKEWRHRRY